MTHNVYISLLSSIIFLTYRDLFTGKDVRKRKTIRKARPTLAFALWLRCQHQDQLEANRTPGLGLRCLAILDAFAELDEHVEDGRIKIGKYMLDIHLLDLLYNAHEAQFALNALSLMYLLHLVDVEKAVQHVHSCANFDGGYRYGTSPGAESHFGQVFTCVSALTIAWRLDLPKLVNSEKLGAWLSERQLKNGGLNGKPEKKEDVCYLQLVDHEQHGHA